MRWKLKILQDRQDGWTQTQRSDHHVADLLHMVYKLIDRCDRFFRGFATIRGRDMPDKQPADFLPKFTLEPAKSDKKKKVEEMTDEELEAYKARKIRRSQAAWCALVKIDPSELYK